MAKLIRPMYQTYPYPYQAEKVFAHLIGNGWSALIVIKLGDEFDPGDDFKSDDSDIVTRVIGCNPADPEKSLRAELGSGKTVTEVMEFLENFWNSRE